ncbi:MAG TPA: transglutaminase domain-containing protein [Oscillospiraceae bacterium]|nr:transglutaminase domain-containing protein [Oscillospiraceae bacterium]HPF55540.1 transglutaminase domain-containing protein [Clostridiales bacterium]HPK35315.1 transglutaminase domain-containing protein [Oscillospiraceae bacterium]HPR76251.1 transglutaminase domain-containing protein [Oscillospiraceae bacterium]
MRLNKLTPLFLAAVLLLTGCSETSSVISVTSIEVSGSTASVSEPDFSVVEVSQESSVASSQPQPETILPEQLKLDTQKIYLADGQSYTINSVVYPADALGKQLVWSSTDNSVASIKEGVVEFVNPGSAVITASTLLGDLTESCQVECITICDTVDKLASVLKVSLLSEDSVFNAYLYDTALLEDLTIDPVYGLYSADVKEKIYFVGDETMSEVYPVTFQLTPNFASSCLTALSSGNLTGLSLLQSQACNSAKKFAEAQLSSGLSDYQKIKIIHDYIVKNGNLDALAGEDAAYSETVAYSVLASDIAVSDGYADAFQLLAGIAGIETRVIVGTVNSQRRVWNLVKLNDSWYHIDIVADDRADMTDGTLNYDYFMISDTRIALTHSWNKAVSLLAPDDYIEK